MLLKNFSLHPNRKSVFLKRKNQSAWDIVLGEKVDSEIWRYLGFQVAATVCQILNLSWLPFSPKLFIKQTRFAFRQHQCLYQSIVIIIIIIQNCENDDTHFCMKRHATYFVITSDLHTCWFYEVRTENDFSFEFHAIVELLCKAMRIGTISLRDVRSLLIDFNKPTVAMTLFVWKSKNGKRDILFDLTLSAKTIHEHISATYVFFWGHQVTYFFLPVFFGSFDINSNEIWTLVGD